jgi:branched-chain amino acid transport system ATP-binding protein
MKPILSVQDLHLQFGGVIAANGIQLDVYPQEIIAIIGPNGCGKTTFLNICTGYMHPSAGDVTFEGKAITSLSPRQITRQGIARAFQIPQLFGDHSVLENVMLAVAARCGIWDVVRPLIRSRYQDEAYAILELLSLQDIAHRKTTTLPEGMRKLTDIALALAIKPRLLLLDEPTAGVSTSEKLPLMDKIIGVLRAEKITALFVEHDMDVVQRYSDRVLVWNAGRVAAEGPPQEVLRRPDVLEQIIGVA